MIRLRHSWRAVIFRVLILALVSTVGGGIDVALAQTTDAKDETLRPEIAKIVTAADEMIKARRYQEALLVIDQAESVAGRTPYENYVMDRLRSVAASAAGDTATAIRSMEAVHAAGRLPPPEQLKVVAALAITAFKAGDFPKTIVWTTRYFKDGGTDPQFRVLLIRSLYLSENFAGAAKELREGLDAGERAGVQPPLEQLQLLATSYAKANDAPGYDYALGKLLAYYPTKEYWADAIRRVETRPGFAEHLALDVLRLQQATGNLASAAQYTAMTQLALKIGMPGEAKRIADQGFASGALGAGPDAEVARRLRDTATKQAAEDEKLLVQNAKDAGAAKDGTALVNVGFALVTAGQYDKGVALMEQGLEKGGVKRPDDARLHLGIAYLAAGQKGKAIQTFKTVQGADGTSELARLWLIHAQRSSS